MKIFHDGILWASIPTFSEKPGTFLNRLVRVNISQNKERILVEPIYQPVLKFDRRGDFTFVTISWNKPALVIIFMPAWPFATFVKPGGYQLEAE